MSEKIFITLGSQKFQFNRLLQAVDTLYEKGVLTEAAYAQTGYSDYEPRFYSYQKFLDRDEFARETEKADIVITHGGTGAIIGAVKKGKKVIAVARRAQYGEHVDDHQLQIIEQFQDQNLICGIPDVNELEQALAYVRTHEFDHYVSNTDVIIHSIEQFIEEKLCD